MDQINLDQYDLVFIDDSSNAYDRSQTILSLSKRLTNKTILVIHDYEVKLYRDMSKTVANRFSFNLVYPNTGVLWRDSLLDWMNLHKLYRVIYEYAKEIPLDDVDSWSNLYDSVFAN